MERGRVIERGMGREEDEEGAELGGGRKNCVGGRGESEDEEEMGKRRTIEEGRLGGNE